MSNANAHTPGPTNLDRLLSDLASGNDDDRSVADSCRFELEQIRDELTDWRDGAKRAASETCGDEVHCTCVPTLRVERAALLAALQRIVSKYDHMRANYDQGDWRLVLKHWGELADEARTALSQAQKGTP